MICCTENREYDLPITILLFMLKAWLQEKFYFYSTCHISTADAPNRPTCNLGGNYTAAITYLRSKGYYIETYFYFPEEDKKKRKTLAVNFAIVPPKHFLPMGGIRNALKENLFKESLNMFFDKKILFKLSHRIFKDDNGKKKFDRFDAMTYLTRKICEP